MCQVTIDAYACRHGLLRVLYCEKRKGPIAKIIQWEEICYLFRSLLTEELHDLTLKCLDPGRQLNVVPMKHHHRSEDCKARGPCNKQLDDLGAHFWGHDGKEVIPMREDEIVVTYDHEDEPRQRLRRR